MPPAIRMGFMIRHNYEYHRVKNWGGTRCRITDSDRRSNGLSDGAQWFPVSVLTPRFNLHTRLQVQSSCSAFIGNVRTAYVPRPTSVTKRIALEVKHINCSRENAAQLSVLQRYDIKRHTP